MVQTLFEKLHFKEERNILVQGLPASVERSFIKIKFSKNVTPLLKTKKIDFALLFAINRIQVERIVPEVMSAMGDRGKLWIAFPKKTSKILSDLTQMEGWNILEKNDYSMVRLIAIDHVWSAARFEKRSNFKMVYGSQKHISEFVDYEKEVVYFPEDLKNLFEQFVEAQLFFESLVFDIQKDFLFWLQDAKTAKQRELRLKGFVEKMLKGDIHI